MCSPHKHMHMHSTQNAHTHTDIFNFHTVMRARDHGIWTLKMHFLETLDKDTCTCNLTWTHRRTEHREHAGRFHFKNITNFILKYHPRVNIFARPRDKINTRSSGSHGAVTVVSLLVRPAQTIAPKCAWESRSFLCAFLFLRINARNTNCTRRIKWTVST